MKTNAELFLTLDKKIRKEIKRKKSWRSIFFIMSFICFGSITYLIYIEYFDPPFGKWGKKSQELNQIIELKSELEEKNRIYISKMDSLQKVNDLLLENSNYYLGVFFEVQIGAFQKFDLSNYEQELAHLRLENVDGYNKYVLGKFRSFEKATAFLNDIRRMGFPDAFIIGKINGERVDLKLAKRESSKVRVY
jgi:hypothetical protein